MSDGGQGTNISSREGSMKPTSRRSRDDGGGGDVQQVPVKTATTEARDVYALKSDDAVDTSKEAIARMLKNGLTKATMDDSTVIDLKDADKRNEFVGAIAEGIQGEANLCAHDAGIANWMLKGDQTGDWVQFLKNRLKMIVALSPALSQGLATPTADQLVTKIAEFNADAKNRLECSGIGIKQRPNDIGAIAIRVAANKESGLAIFYLDPERRCVVVRTDLSHKAPNTTSLTQLVSRTVEPVRFKSPDLDSGDTPVAGVVQVVVGTSGSGKTSYMLTARAPSTTEADRGETLVTFFVAAGNVADAVKHAEAGAEAQKLAWQRMVAISREENSDDARDARDARNASVLAALTEMLKDAVTELAGSGQQVGPTRGGTKLRVRVAIDEAGPYHGLTRAVIAKHGSIRDHVRKLCNLDAAVPVDIMIGGTGSGSPVQTYGSAVYASDYEVIDMEDAKWRNDFAKHFELPKAVADVVFSKNNPATSESSLAAVQELLSNPRMGALIQKGLHNMTTLAERCLARTWPQLTGLGTKIEEPPVSLEALTDATQAVIKDAMRWFVRMNGMYSLLLPALQSVLADAMSIDVCGFDAIGSDAALSAPLREHIDAAKLAGVPERDVLHYLLVTTFGVLHDRARPDGRGSSFNRKEARELPPLASAGSDALYVPNDGKGRYVMPATYRVMFTAWCMDELPRVHGGADSDGLERLLWQWGAALQLCVPRGGTLGALVKQMLHGGIVLRDDTSPKPVSPVGRGKVFKGRRMSAASLTHGSFGKQSGPLTGRGQAHLLVAKAKCPCAWTYDHEDVTSSELLQPKTGDTEPMCMSVLNAPFASYADVMHSAAWRESKEAARVTREHVLIQAKLYPKTVISQKDITAEFDKMRGKKAPDVETAGKKKSQAKGKSKKRQMHAQLQTVSGAKSKAPPQDVDEESVCVLFVVTAQAASITNCKAYVKGRDGGPTGDKDVVVIVPCDANATVNPSVLPKELSAFKLTYPVLFPLALGRLNTWTATKASEEADASGDDDM